MIEFTLALVDTDSVPPKGGVIWVMPSNKAVVEANAEAVRSMADMLKEYAIAPTARIEDFTMRRGTVLVIWDHLNTPDEIEKLFDDCIEEAK